MNEEIKDKEIRLISDDGEQLGVMLTKDALDMAEEKKLDLVKISPNADPPVCKIMDFGKFKYEQSKKEKEAKKKQKVIDVKEIRLTPRTDDHDIDVKANRAKKFLADGDKVKVTVRFRGRETGHTAFGMEILNKFAELIEEVGVIEKTASMEGRSLTMVLSPKKA